MKNRPVKISLFHCSNSISSEDVSEVSSRLDGVEIRPVSVPCSGKVAIEYILKSIETGSDLAVLSGCKDGECKFLQGNLRARKRAGGINDLLKEIGMNNNSVQFIQFTEMNRAESIVKELERCVRKLTNGREKTIETF